MNELIAAKHETVLVVDDTPLVLHVVVAILEKADYSVLQATSGQEALEVAADFPGTIHLLLSDVMMPGMSGPALGILLKVARPKMHVMFMSGYPGGDLLVLNYGWAFIEKPFLTQKLLEMINAVLHAPDKSQGSYQFDTRKDKDSQE